MKEQKTLLLFAHHSTEDSIPEETIQYLSHLEKLFDEVMVVSDNQNLNSEEYNVFHCENIGYDFGKYYRALKKINVEEYERIAFVNDSCYVVDDANFDKISDFNNDREFDFWGLTDSFEKPGCYESEEDTAYHIQSYFLVFEKSSIPLINKFFEDIKFDDFLSTDYKGDVRQYIINNCEVGLTKYMMDKNLKCSAAWSVHEILKDSDDFTRKVANLHLHFWEELIFMGFPLIKKKLINGEWDGIAPNTDSWMIHYTSP